MTRELLAKQERYKVLRESPDEKATMAMMEPMDRTVPWVHLDQGVSPGHLEIKVSCTIMKIEEAYACGVASSKLHKNESCV